MEKPAFLSGKQARTAFTLTEKQGVLLLEAVRHIHENNFAIFKRAVRDMGNIRSAHFHMMQYSSRYDAVLACEKPNIVSLRHGGGALNSFHTGSGNSLSPPALPGMGYTAKGRNMRTQETKADKAVAAALQLEPGSPVIKSIHLFYANDAFCVLCHDHLDAAFLTKEDITRLNLETSVVFRLLYEKTGRKISWDLLELTLGDTAKTPELLGYAGLPNGTYKAYLRTMCTLYDHNNRPLMYADSHHDPDYFTFGMVRKQRYTFEDLLSEPANLP